MRHPRNPRGSALTFGPVSLRCMNALFRTLRERPFRLATIGLGALALAGMLSFIVYITHIARQVPALEELTRHPRSLSTVVYTADGQELTRFHREYRTWIPYTSISEHAIRALLATEDHRFYSHGGVDFLRLASSAAKTLLGSRQGGSTITMQLVRNLRPELQHEPSYQRKVKEIVLSLELERNWEKERILEAYLNTVSFGPMVFGIEAAAHTFFDKPASALDIHESALLVGLLKGPSWYNPVKHPERALQRRNVVLSRLKDEGYIDAVQYTRYANMPLALRYRPPVWKADLAPHFAEHVRRWLEAWGEQAGYDIYRDGLRVYTTLDSRLQAHARASVDDQMRALQAVVDYEWSRETLSPLGTEPAAYLQRVETEHVEPFAHFWATHQDLLQEYVQATERHQRLVEGGMHPTAALIQLSFDRAFMDSLRTAHSRLEVGLAAIDPATGHVRAWVGGRDFERDQFDKVALARRQPGSTFKPFVFATAIDHGYRPDDKLSDTPVVYRDPDTKRVWMPRSTATGGTLTLRNALAYSSNSVATKLTLEMGPYRIVETAKRMGIRSALNAVPSVGLGTSEVTLLELTSAYATLAGSGMYREPVVITRIEDHEGNIIARFEPEPQKAISVFTAYAVLDMLRSVVNYGTGSRIRTTFGIHEDVAGKTGTTQRNADGWFVLLHPGLVTGVWTGFNDLRITFRSNQWGQGGYNALNVAGDFLRRVLNDDQRTITRQGFTPPPGYLAAEPQQLRKASNVLARSEQVAPLMNDMVLMGSPDSPIGTSPDLTNPDADLERALRSALVLQADSTISPMHPNTAQEE